MGQFQSVEDLGDLSGKRAIVRADLNVPMQDGQVSDSTRIHAAAATVKALNKKGAQIILLSHFGRPKGERVPEMSLAPLVGPLKEAFGLDVAFGADCIGDAAMSAINSGAPVVLLENLRYHNGETENDPAFVAELAKLGDLYVNDAFSCSHRAHASTYGLAKALPAYAGVTMGMELSALQSALGEPKRPLAAVVGGAKVSSKLDVLTNLVEKVDHLIIGGGMANTFLAAQGVDVGASLCEHDLADTARAIMNKASGAGCTIHLPTDIVVAKEFKAGAANRTVGLKDVAADDMILDVGQQSTEDLIKVISTCNTLIWNGPLGAFEIEPFDRATVALAQAAAKLSAEGLLLTVAGGGDTVAALAHAGAKDSFTHVSTAGGAFLEWMEGKELPGVSALS